MVNVFVRRLVSSRRHNSELLVQDFVRLMQLLRGEVRRFRRLAVYVRAGFWRIDSVVRIVDVVK